MTDEQLQKFHKLRIQYLKDLSKLRKYYMKKFKEILLSSN